MATSLTHAQAKLLAFIKRYQSEKSGASPSFAEMKRELGLLSKSGVHRLVDALEERGHIRRPKVKRARAIEVLSLNPLEDVPTAALTAEIARRGFSSPAIQKRSL